MAKAGKPNILVLWGDDIGWWNISYNNRGQMGYRTPNIDRIGNEGATFTDYYGQQSCTAGRAAFITGQNPVRTGLSKVGMPGATIAEAIDASKPIQMILPVLIVDLHCSDFRGAPSRRSLPRAMAQNRRKSCRPRT